jgi:hypothetical protein
MPLGILYGVLWSTLFSVLLTLNQRKPLLKASPLQVFILICIDRFHPSCKPIMCFSEGFLVNTDSIDMVPVLVYCFTFEVGTVDYNKKKITIQKGMFQVPFSTLSV